MCNFCDAAKRLFSRNNLKYEEIDISSKDGLRDEMIKKANGKRTIPQIFFDNVHIGGYQELRALEKNGELNNLLKWIKDKGGEILYPERLINSIYFDNINLNNDNNLYHHLFE